MKNDGAHDICERTFEFAVSVVCFCQKLEAAPGVNRRLSSQLLRSGTSIGANVQEAQAGQSKADFIAKLTISLKEVRETCYWLRLFAATSPQHATEATRLQAEADQLARILAAIIVSARKPQ